MVDQIIDLIIVNYNSTDYAIQCIDSIYKSALGYKLHIIVVDNASNDNPIRIIKKHPNVDLIYNRENFGFSTAVNIGIEKTSSETLILLNPDTIVSDRFFGKIVSYLNENQDVAIVGPKIFESNGNVQGSARRFPNALSSIFGRKSPVTKIFPNNPVTKREFVCFNHNNDSPIEVDWVSGACMVARKTALKSVGCFDEKYFLYWEDADLCKRLNNAGWRIIYFPQAEIYHHTGTSSNTAPIASILHFHKSCYLLFNKNAGWLLKIIMPFPLLGLCMRCLFVIGLNEFQRKIRSENGKLPKIQIRKNTYKKQNNKIKILRVISRLNIGGPSIHCSILLSGLNNERYTSKLVAGSISPNEGDMSYIIENKESYFLKIPEMQREVNLLKDLMAFVKILRICIQEKPDIVHTHMAKAGAVTRVAVWIHNLISKKKIKTVHTFHGNVLEGYFSTSKSKVFLFIEKLLAMVTNVIIAISQTQKWELSEKYKLASEKKIRKVNLGFDLEPFLDKKWKGKLRAELNLEDDTLLIGIVGRLVPIKNHVLFLEAAKIILNENQNLKFRFLIVGNGELRDALEIYSEKIGIRKDVSFYGWAKDMNKIYVDLNILMLTSNNEGTPVSIIEAMAADVPVIATAVGGIKDIFGRIIKGDYENTGFKICERGILCPKGNQIALAKGVSYLLKTESRESVEKGREYILENYTVNRLVENMKNIYETLL